MLNQHSLGEIAEIHNLLGDIKKEYEEGIKPILIKSSQKLFKNPSKLMGIVKKVGQKLDDKMKSGEIKESDYGKGRLRGLVPQIRMLVLVLVVHTLMDSLDRERRQLPPGIANCHLE